MLYIPEKEEIIRKKNWKSGDKFMIFGSGCSHHGFLLMGDSQLFGWGWNCGYQLGLKDSKDRSQLTPIPFFDKSKKITKVSCGYQHTIFLSKNEVYSSGNNSSGQIGMPSNIGRVVEPTRVKITEENQTVKALDIFAGDCHSLVLSTLLEVYSFGFNGYGQLGVGDINERHTPTKVLLTERIISVSCGGDHSYFISVEGVIFVTGQNNHGQCCSSKKYIIIPIKLLFKEKEIIQISCGYSYTVYLTSTRSDNKVYVSGQNNHGQLGIENLNDQKTPTLVSNLENEKIIRVKCGADHTCFSSKKKMWLNGNNLFGQLCNGNTNQFSHSSPILFSIKGKKIVQSLMLYTSSIFFTKNEVYGAGVTGNGELLSLIGLHAKNHPNPSKIQDLEVKRVKIKNSREIMERLEFIMMKDFKKEIRLIL